MLFGTQFNQSISDVLGLGATPNQSLLFQIQQSKKKNLTGIFASAYFPDSSILAATIPNAFGRLIVCTGTLATNSRGVTLPITPASTTLPVGADRVLLDIDFINVYNEDFNEPWQVQADETLNVLITQGFQQGAATAVAALTARLSIKGWMGEKQDSDFPFRTR